MLQVVEEFRWGKESHFYSHTKGLTKVHQRFCYLLLSLFTLFIWFYLNYFIVLESTLDQLRLC